MTAKKQCPNCKGKMVIGANVCMHCGYKQTESELKYDNMLRVWSLLFACLFLGYCSLSKGCSGDNSNNTTTNVGVEAAPNSTVVNEANNNSTTASLSDNSNNTLSLSEKESACKKAISELMGKSTSIMSAKNIEDGMVRVTYKRPDDGKIFKNDCKFVGNSIIWRGVDIFSTGEGPGRWRDGVSDEKITWQRSGKSLEVNVGY